MKTFHLYLLEHWLIWRYTGGDETALSRLRAIARLRTRYRMREYRELLEFGERFGRREEVAEAIYFSLLVELEERLEAMR